VETAIFGVTGIALSNANVTLTATQAGSSQIKLTGTLSANVSITFPTVGQWEVYNATSGSFTVTLTNGTGSSVTVAQGAVLAIMSDSTAGILSTANASIAQTARIGVNVAGSPNITSEVQYAFVSNCVIPANFAGANVYGVSASGGSAPYTVNVNKYIGNSVSSSQVGTITVVPGGTSTFSTTGGTSVSFSAGDRLSYTFPTANLSLFVCTLVGTYS
jgi:hypothetical protein